jgi:hypothetical protein
MGKPQPTLTLQFRLLSSHLSQGGTEIWLQDQLLPLGNNLARLPGANPLYILGRGKASRNLDKLLGIKSTVKAHLSRNLNHHARQHKSWVGRAATRRKGPRAKQCQSLYCGQGVGNGPER